MPWWFWILLWVALAATALLFYVFVGWRLVKSFMALMRQARQSADQLVPEGGFGSAELPLHPQPLPGVFQDPTAARAHWEAGKAARREARRARRVERRLANGQPRALRDLPDL